MCLCDRTEVLQIECSEDVLVVHHCRLFDVSDLTCLKPPQLNIHGWTFIMETESCLQCRADSCQAEQMAETWLDGLMAVLTAVT